MRYTLLLLLYNRVVLLLFEYDIIDVVLILLISTVIKIIIIITILVVICYIITIHVNGNRNINNETVVYIFIVINLVEYTVCDL